MIIPVVITAMMVPFLHLYHQDPAGRRAANNEGVKVGLGLQANNRTKVGSITMQQVEDHGGSPISNANGMTAVKSIMGTARSMGIG